MTATTVDTDIIHVFEPGSDPARRPLLLLHGTGGDERDLLSLGRTVAPGASLLSPRGKVLEGSAPRFFRRLAEGVFDEADLKRRTDELAEFVLWARERYGLPARYSLVVSIQTQQTDVDLYAAVAQKIPAVNVVAVNT